MVEKIPAVFMRGGSSKGLFFKEEDLPKDSVSRDKFILAAYGSPDTNCRQIDGVGGATSTTSKVAIIRPSTNPDADIDYIFGQVAIDRAIIDYKGNCGNISSAVGPYAIDEGMVPVQEPITVVRIYQVNTKKIIFAEVPVENGRAKENGDYVVDGVPGSGAKINLRFISPGGSVTGKLLPTGQVKQHIKLPDGRSIPMSIVDASNPVVFVRAVDLGLNGAEIDEIDSNPEISALLEFIRAKSAVILGFAASIAEASASCQAVPKIAFVSPAQNYTTQSGDVILHSQMDICARIMSMGKLHKAFALTGAICTAGAARIEGTVVHEVCCQSEGIVRIGHPGGILMINPIMEKSAEGYIYREAQAGRTARRLMEGYVYA